MRQKNMKVANFSSQGLGDGLIALMLSHNLYLNGYEIDTFHNTLDQMQSYFSNLPIKKYPGLDDIDEILKNYDQIFISYNELGDNFLRSARAGIKQNCIIIHGKENIIPLMNGNILLVMLLLTTIKSRR